MSSISLSPLAARRHSGAAKFACATLFAALALAAGQARAEDLIVKYDQSQLLRLPRPASEIIIGNPMIADVSIQSGNLLVITGKSFGITNMIVLDAERNVIQDQRVMVQRDEVKIVNLMKGSARQTYNCTPQCNPSIVIGDDPVYFSQVSGSSGQKIGQTEKSADGGQQSGGQ